MARELLVALAAGIAACAGAWSLLHSRKLRELPHRVADRLPGRFSEYGLTAVAGGLRRTGSAGAGARQVVLGLAAWMLAAPLIGAVPAVCVGLGALPAASAARRARDRRRAEAIDRCAGELAQALAASLAAGNSLHSALATAAASVSEPLRPLVAHASRRLALGFRVDDVLSELARATSGRRIEMLAGALLLQRRSGGDTVLLLREFAASFRRDDAAFDAARGATTQARITAWIVIAAPLGVAVLAELVHRGALVGVFAVPLALVVLALATASHVLGAALVLRIARVEE